MCFVLIVVFDVQACVVLVLACCCRGPVDVMFELLFFVGKVLLSCIVL